MSQSGSEGGTSAYSWVGRVSVNVPLNSFYVDKAALLFF